MFTDVVSISWLYYHKSSIEAGIIKSVKNPTKPKFNFFLFLIMMQLNTFISSLYNIRHIFLLESSASL